MRHPSHDTAFLLLFIAALAVAPLFLPEFYVTLLNYIGLYAIVALGLVMLTGVGGLTSFGQAAFVGLGAYTSAYLTTVHGVSPWLTLPAGLLVTAVVAGSLGLVTLRLSGHFLPLGTIAWGISLYYLFGNLNALGGHTGITGIPPLQFFDLEIRSGREFFYLIWVVLLVVVLATRNLLDSREGRAIRALRGGSLMAEAMGVNTPRAKIVIFTVAALYASVSGWLYAHLQRFVNPTPFSLTQGIEYLFMAVVGGVAHVWGAIVGAGLITILKQWLQDWLPTLLGQSGNFEVIVFGLLMIFVLHRARDGVWPILMRLFPQSVSRVRVRGGRVAGASSAAGIGFAAARGDRCEQAFWRPGGQRQGQLHGPGWRGDGADRTQWGRQDDDVQRHFRRRSAEFRRGRLSRRTHRVLAGAPHRPPGHEPYFSARPLAGRNERHRERRHRCPPARPQGLRRCRLPC
jgi:ABC-type branched-subunit amino acid transport system permease subunit